MAIYINIRRLLENRKLEQKDLAEALNVSSKTAHNYLNGHTKIVADQLPAIARLLRVSIAELFSEKVEVPGSEFPCPDCQEKENEIALLNKKLVDVHEKYTHCLEELLGKKGHQARNSA